MDLTGSPQSCRQGRQLSIFWVVAVPDRNICYSLKDEIVEMKSGDYINIPAHCKHRVEWTDLEEDTIWLAVHY